MITKTKSSQIRLATTITEQCKTELDHVQKQLKLSKQGETVSALLDAYRELQELKKKMSVESNEFDLSPSEQEEVSKAVERSGMSQEQLAKRGLLKEARTALSLAKYQDKLSEIDPEKLRKMTFRGVASARIENAVTKLMNYNDTRGEQKDRRCISETFIAKLSGSNRNAVRDYFDSHKLMIDDHNAKYSLTIADNRKGKGIDLKQILGL